jgi:hypothetical protein
MQCCSESAAVYSKGDAVTTGSVTDAFIDVGSSSGFIALHCSSVNAAVTTNTKADAVGTTAHSLMQ